MNICLRAVNISLPSLNIDFYVKLKLFSQRFILLDEKNIVFILRFARLFVPLQKMIHYADLILPVPLQGLFTYAIPEGMNVGVGMRVLVTFGRSKT